MARVKYASLVSGISGSIGSVTFQKSLYGNTLRTKPIPRHSRSPLQYTRRQMMMEIHQGWADLTNAERVQWNQFVSFSSASIRRDKNVLLTGHSLFIQYNYMRLLAGLTLLVSIDYNLLPRNTGNIALAVGANQSLLLTLDADYIETQQFFIFKISSPRRSSLSFAAKGILYLPIVTVAGSPYEIGNFYATTFGPLPIIDDTVHYTIRWFSLTSPILSGIYSGTCLVTQQP
ncbi:MAG: hypothetical protein IMZ70_02220 [Candidatus Atribacteria bacterium]|nr:hypothetical protein [Candidatus Atribacteria bacterium]